MHYKKIIFTIILLLSLIQSVSSALPGDEILFTRIPEELEIRVNETTDFDVTLRNSGLYADVSLHFRNLPDGITVLEGGGYNLLGKRRSIQIKVVLAADESVERGTYEFEIADNSDEDFMTWTNITLYVLGEGDQSVIENRRRMDLANRRARAEELPNESNTADINNTSEDLINATTPASDKKEANIKIQIPGWSTILQTLTVLTFVSVIVLTFVIIGYVMWKYEWHRDADEVEPAESDEHESEPLDDM